MTTPEVQQWEEELEDGDFLKLGYHECYDDGCCGPRSELDMDKIKDFIRSLLQAKEREVLEWVLRTVDWGSTRPMGDLLKELQRRLALNEK